MKPTITTLAAALAAAATLHAQPGEGMPPGPPPMPPIVAVLDADEDGTLSAGEIGNAPAALATLDENGDGQLTRDELRPEPPEGEPEAGGAPDAEGEEQAEKPGRGRGRRGHMGMSPVAAVLDADRDRTISAEEIANAAEALSALDKNEDGEISPEELFPRRGRGPRPDGDDDGGEGPGGPPRGGPGGPGPRVR